MLISNLEVKKMYFYTIISTNKEKYPFTETCYYRHVVQAMFNNEYMPMLFEVVNHSKDTVSHEEIYDGLMQATDVAI